MKVDVFDWTTKVGYTNNYHTMFTRESFYYTS